MDFRARMAEKQSLGVMRRLPAVRPPLRKSLSTSDIRSNKENALKRAAAAPLKPLQPPRLAPKKACPSATTTSKTPAKSAPAKKIPLYDYKARFNDLLEKHKPMKAEYMEMKRNHDELNEELNELRTDKDNFSKSVQNYVKKLEENEVEIGQYKKSLGDTKSRLRSVTRDYEELKQKYATIEKRLTLTESDFCEVSRKLCLNEEISRQQEQMISSQEETIRELQETTQKLHWERRSLHNKLQDLKGNIRVVFRVRPALAPGRPVAMLNFPDACTVEMERLEPGAARRLNKHDFKFDRVFGPMSSQEDVWEEVSCLIQSALDGYHVCIFAYGQTGSGKTYTMEGTREAPGVIPRCCNMLFDSIKQLSRSGWKYTVYASFLEIYNEHLYDLLEPGKDPKELDIRMLDAKGSDVYVTNLTEQEVKNDIELQRLVARAQIHRQTAATASNERSSRSHSVARIRLVAEHAEKAITMSCRLCLVDLAGSESAKTTQRLNETKNINRSLSELGQVILALQQKQEHIPYRNSKLTRLLEPQLGGAAKALLVAAAAPYDDCSHESLSTLRFATRVGQCSTATARRNLALAQPTAVQSKEQPPN